ncbi:unnamed protein product [Ectocarpus fasciculatus]
MDNGNVQPSKKRSFDEISREPIPTSPDTAEADREGGEGWQCSPSPHAAATISTDTDAADRLGQILTKEDASKGGGETGKCVEGMISDVDANRTGKAVDLSIGPPQSQDSHEAVANSPDAGSSELPLSPEDIRSFEENGFVMLKRAFDPDVAAACRESLWKRLKGDGIRREEPATWVRKIGIAEIYGISSSPKKRRGHPWKGALSPKLKSAVDQLAGVDSWEEFGCGWWMVTFPGFAQPPWGAEGKWHIDGAHFRHYPHSREIGILPIFLFSDVRKHGGGTAVLRGSHKKVAKILWNSAGTTGLTGPELSNAAREALLPAADDDVVETNGDAGDVLLTHPLLLHSRSTNLAPVEESGVRFMCHPAIPLKDHLDLHSAPEMRSVLERVMMQACPVGGRCLPDMDAGVSADGRGIVSGNADAGTAGTMHHAIPKPAECDHSSVELRPAATPKGVHKNAGGGKRGRWKGKAKGRCRPTETKAPQQQQQLHSGVEGGSPENYVADNADRGSQLDVGGGRPGAKDEQSEIDAQFVRTSSSCSIDKTLDVPASGGAAHDEVDTVVLHAMGFSNFGGSRG